MACTYVLERKWINRKKGFFFLFWLSLLLWLVWFSLGQGVTVQLLLSWKSLCKPGWAQIHRATPASAS